MASSEAFQSLRRTPIPTITVPTLAAERAVLVGIGPLPNKVMWSLEDSIEELKQLAITAGAEVVGSVTQRGVPHPTHYLGKGKLQDLKALATRLQCHVAIFDDELSPNQGRNLERVLEIKVIDRTALILDIFAAHASTREGSLQVSLAQQEYLLPRLAGQWSHLERLGGGIGTRGPGETQIETDRRMIRQNIQKLRRQLESVRRRRSIYRNRRKVIGIPTVSMVGYTNAGKSTLLNALTGATVLTQDRLFSTLDPVTRRLTLPDGRPILLTDTVGFIQKLPRRIIAAFRATLEELASADVLLHVVDITHPNAPEQTQEVTKILDDLGFTRIPTILVLNKADLQIEVGEGEEVEDGSVAFSDETIVSAIVSAKRHWGLSELTTQISDVLNRVEQEFAGGDEHRREAPMSHYKCYVKGGYVR